MLMSPHRQLSIAILRITGDGGSRLEMPDRTKPDDKGIQHAATHARFEA